MLCEHRPYAGAAYHCLLPAGHYTETPAADGSPASFHSDLVLGWRNDGVLVNLDGSEIGPANPAQALVSVVVEPGETHAAINSAAADVQNLIPKQPWGRHGNEPVPIDLTFNERAPADSRWTVRYVQRVTSTKRVYAFASGATVADALNNALRAQRRSTSRATDNIAYHR
jgi:hypothetical protein